MKIIAADNANVYFNSENFSKAYVKEVPYLDEKKVPGARYKVMVYLKDGSVCCFAKCKTIELAWKAMSSLVTSIVENENDVIDYGGEKGIDWL